MLIGRIQGRPVVLYESVQESIDLRSCIACIKYLDDRPCRVYSDCRAEKEEGEEPLLFARAMNRDIARRFYIIEKEEKDGLKRIRGNR